MGEDGETVSSHVDDGPHPGVELSHSALKADRIRHHTIRMRDSLASVARGQETVHLAAGDSGSSQSPLHHLIGSLLRTFAAAKLLEL